MYKTIIGSWNYWYQIWSQNFKTVPILVAKMWLMRVWGKIPNFCQPHFCQQCWSFFHNFVTKFGITDFSYQCYYTLLAPNFCLNQCWNIFSGNWGIKPNWNLSQNLSNAYVKKKCIWTCLHQNVKAFCLGRSVLTVLVPTMVNKVNSLAPGKIQFNFRKVIFKLILVNVGCGISYEFAHRWMPQDLTDDKSTLVQVMAWGRQATSHYLRQYWPRSMSSNGVTRPQWVNTITADAKGKQA